MQLHEKYKIDRNQIVTLIRVCKETTKQILKDMEWYYILSMKNTIVSHKYCLLIDKALTTNEKDIVNHFNTIFKSVVQKLVKKVPPTHNNFKNH